MGSYREGHEIIEKLMEYLRADVKDELVSFERVNNMVEFLQCYALKVKKDKNVSYDMEDVLHPKEQKSSKVLAIANDQQKA